MVGSGSVWRGLIVMWHGALADIPVGFQLCDGTNGTPDLRDKFILGSLPGENPGATGGSRTYPHTGTNVSDHAALTHTGTNVGDHAALTHSQPTESAVKIGTSSTTGAPLAHTHPSHTIPSHSVTQPSQHGIQTHSVTQPNEHTDVQPPYYKLAFIMLM